MDGKIPSRNLCHGAIFGSIPVLLQFRLWLPNQLKGWALTVSFWTKSLCSKLPGSFLWICAMGINDNIEQDWTQEHTSSSDAAPLGASGTLDPVCCSCSSSPSLFVSNFPHATILSPSTRVQTAEIRHVVFPWKTHYFSKPCVGSPVLVPPCYILRLFSIYSLSSNYPSQKWSLKPCRLLRSG